MEISATLYSHPNHCLRRYYLRSPLQAESEENLNQGRMPAIKP
jgi:hypothetical protein